MIFLETPDTIKLLLLAVLLLACASATTNAQSCLTPDDIKQMLARVGGPPPAKLDKKLKEELLKMANKQRELLVQVVENDQTKEKDQKKLHKLYDANTVRLCEILKTHGWPTSALVDREGVNAAFRILSVGSFEMQRDLLNVIAAVIKTDPSQKGEFAGIYDRLRVSAGMKQLFGTQAVSMGGFLVLYPIEDQAKLDARRAEFNLSPMADYIRNLERIYGKPLVKARQAPTSQLSKQLTESVTKAIDSTQLEGEEVDPGDVIKVETNLVNLNVSVFSNKAKMFVGSLAKEEFRVLENNQEQTVALCFDSRAVRSRVVNRLVRFDYRQAQLDQEIDAAIHRGGTTDRQAGDCHVHAYYKHRVTADVRPRSTRRECREDAGRWRVKRVGRGEIRSRRNNWTEVVGTASRSCADERRSRRISAACWSIAWFDDDLRRPARTGATDRCADRPDPPGYRGRLPRLPEREV
jgi:hypothetical protein